jgi:peptide deformylase
VIIQDKKELEIKCSPVSIKEGEEIGVRLLHELRESENGIGLAANQIVFSRFQSKNYQTRKYCS